MTDDCPVCGEPAAYRCRCLLSDKGCRNGHRWHACPECGGVAVGGATHTKDADDRCEACKRLSPS